MGGMFPGFMRRGRQKPFDPLDRSDPRYQPFETIEVTPESQEPFEELYAEPQEGMDWYGRSSSARDSYLDHLAGMPQRPKVGTGRNIIAALASGLAGATGGIGQGMNVGNQIKYGGFNQDMGDWEQKGRAMKEAAEIEREENKDVTAQQLASSLVSRREAQTENDKLQREIKERDLNIREERNEQLHNEAMKRIEAMEDRTAATRERNSELARHARENEQIGRERNILRRMEYDWRKAYQGKTLDDKGNPIVKPYAQKSIREMAKEEIGQDPEFAAYFRLSPQGIRMFDLSDEKDPAKKAALAKRIKRRLQEAQAMIISKRYSDYFNFDEIEGAPDLGDEDDDDFGLGEGY